MMTITHKLTLQEANLIKNALEAYRDAQLARIVQGGGFNAMPGTAREVGRTEDLLRRDFNWSPPSKPTVG